MARWQFRWASVCTAVASLSLVLPAGAASGSDPSASDTSASGTSAGASADGRATSLAGMDEERARQLSLASEGPGLEYRSPYLVLNAWLRGQLRHSDPFDSDPLTVDGVEDPPGSDFDLRRGRIKVEGDLLRSGVGFYYEQELTGDRPLLDLRLDLVIRDDLRARFGQYKVFYNRERVDSSGKQQFAERSIATYPFTLDRQRGLTVSKHWGADTTRDQWLMLGLFEGDGRGKGESGGDAMLVGRWEWAFLGEALPFSQSDLAFRQRPAATLAFGAARVRGPYTRYSSSGGGQLDGFTEGGDSRYTLVQWLEEFAWHYDGYSVQQEYHEKRIDDHETGRDSLLRGGYLQAGKAWPVRMFQGSRAIEVAARLARVDWDDAPDDRVQTELTVGANLFLAGHDNKLTVDVSRLRVKESGLGSADDTRVRLQWDVSF